MAAMEADGWYAWRSSTPCEVFLQVVGAGGPLSRLLKKILKEKLSCSVDESEDRNFILKSACEMSQME